MEQGFEFLPSIQLPVLLASLCWNVCDMHICSCPACFSRLRPLHNCRHLVCPISAKPIERYDAAAGRAQVLLEAMEDVREVARRRSDTVVSMHTLVTSGAPASALHHGKPRAVMSGQFLALSIPRNRPTATLTLPTSSI